MDEIGNDYLYPIALLYEIIDKLEEYQEDINNPTDNYKLYSNIHNLFIIAKTLDIDFNPNNKIKTWTLNEVDELVLKLDSKFNIKFHKEEVNKFYYCLYLKYGMTFELCLSKFNNSLYVCLRNDKNYRFKSQLVYSEEDVLSSFKDFIKRR